MPTQIEVFDLTQILSPVQAPADARIDALVFGASLTIAKGQAIAIKTSDKKGYALNRTGSVNEVQLIAITGTLSAGSWSININGKATGPIAYNANTAAIQTALDNVFGASQIVAGGTAETATTLTFSGTNWRNVDQPLVEVDVTGVTGATGATVTQSTRGALAFDGTELCVGLSKFSFVTDANGKVFYGPSAAAGYRTGPWSTSPIYRSGVFDPADLSTSATTVAQVDTHTPASAATDDVFTLTFTNGAGQTFSTSFTVGATTTAAAVSAGLIAAWNADPVLASIATASGTVTVILTAKNPGYAMSTSGAVVGSGTLTKVATNAASGTSIDDILPGIPGARVLHNGFWQLP